MSRSSKSCAACKNRHGACTQACVFAPYFTRDKADEYDGVQRIYRRDNVHKILSKLSTYSEIERASKSLVFEARARDKDKVYGVVGLVRDLQHRLEQVQAELQNAKKELTDLIKAKVDRAMTPPGHGHEDVDFDFEVMDMEMLEQVQE
ncbi:LOB domain-containing protein 36-like protein [Tanacetum coccineum]